VLPRIEAFEADSWVGDAAGFIAARIRAVVGEHGCCRLALAGGGTPKPVYEVLATLDVPWPMVELLWGDERCVPADDPDSNFRMAKEALIDRVDIPATEIYRIEGERGMEAAARAYEVLLDLAPVHINLLGMGDDGHTASLFPGNDLGAAGPRAIPVIGPKPPPERVSMSLKAINESTEVIFLVTGAGKAGRLREIHEQIRSGEPLLPAARVKPERNLVWLLDTDAASQLEMSNPPPSRGR
jgi:6-phosphogluconolactonase